VSSVSVKQSHSRATVETEVMKLDCFISRNRIVEKSSDRDAVSKATKERDGFDGDAVSNATNTKERGEDDNRNMQERQVLHAQLRCASGDRRTG
jgi:hypothetical protein